MVILQSASSSQYAVGQYEMNGKPALDVESVGSSLNQSPVRRKKGSLNKTRNRISSLFRSPSSLSNNVSRASQSPSPSPGPSSTSPLAAAPGEISRSNVPSPRGSAGGSKPPPAPSAGSGIQTPTLRKDPSQKGSAGYAALGIEADGQILSPSSRLVAEPQSIDADQTSTTAFPIVTRVENSSIPAAAASALERDTHHTRQRSASLYSEWSYDYEDNESDSDGEVYATPPEGLSEVDEGDEDDIEAETRSLTATRLGGNASNAPDRLPTAAVGNKTIVTSTSPSADSAALISRASVSHTASVPNTPITPIAPASHKSALSTKEQARMLQDDVVMCQRIIRLFLTSRMKEAEALVHEQDPDAQHMYLQNAAAVIQCIKGMMTFDAGDLNTALEIARRTSALAHSLRKPQTGLFGKVAGALRGNSASTIAAMSLLEKHAELVYAESLLIKAVLGIVAGGDWVGLIKEALNMRTAHGIYRTLQLYLAHADHHGGDKGIDEHFKSGVQLGTGLSSLMLSLMPGKVLRVAELFGYAGDRRVALETLMAPGGWSNDPNQTLPLFDETNDGVRRPICDMVLLAFHLVISVLMPVSGVDIPVAKNILDWNLKRYPNGIFFMYFQSRLHTTQAQPEMANKTLQYALDLKLEYVQLQHMCLWDMAVNNMMLNNFKRSQSCFEILRKESNWSKAVYLYASGACVIELQADGQAAASKDEVIEGMTSVPMNMRKIAGKSLPIEKFVSRKARKFIGQGNRLILPAIELGYFFGALPNSPPRLLYNVVIPRIERNIDELNSSTPEAYGTNGNEYWDDFCLANFLHGVSLSFAGYPHVEAVITAADAATSTMTPEEAAVKAEQCFQTVLQHGPKIQLDHWLVFHTHFELGRLFSQMGDNAKAKHHLQLLMSGKGMEVSHLMKGKYSMESALMLKAHAGLQAIKESHTAKMH